MLTNSIAPKIIILTHTCLYQWTNAITHLQRFYISFILINIRSL